MFYVGQRNRNRAVGDHEHHVPTASDPLEERLGGRGCKLPMFNDGHFCCLEVLC